MRRAIATVLLTLLVSTGTIVGAARAEASTSTPDRLCTHGVCATIHWTAKNERYAYSILSPRTLPRIKRGGRVTYIGYTYRDVAGGKYLYSIKRKHHYYLYVVA